MPALPPTRYRIVASDPHAHVFEVACTVEHPDPSGQRFRLPAWIPGSYLIREFARHVVAVRAHDAQGPVPIAKEAKDVWRAARCAGPLTVTAEVYANDLSVRAAYLDAARAFFNGTSVFLCPDGRAEAECIVEIAPPPHDAGRQWKVATTLPREGAQPWGFGTYRARDYETLVDHPVEMSDFSRASFEAGGVAHDVAISGRHEADLPRLARDLARVCQSHVDLFGGAKGSRAPFDRYLFLVHALPDGYGGLEHRDSTALVCARDELPREGVAAVTDDYRRFLGLASHEYFHAWNVKRIRPAAFVPYDLSRESYTRQLWAFEGLTSYYDDLALVRSGVIDAESYLELVGRTVSNVLRTPGRAVQSVADSSFDAWIKYYRQDENTPNAVVSYYAKGSLVALALDLTLRGRGSSLDALVRLLWERYGRTGAGVPEDAIARHAADLAREPLDGFFARYVDGTEDPPLRELLAEVGVTLSLRPSEGGKDKGGRPGKSPEHERPLSFLGARADDGSEPKLVHVHRDGPAARAGLSAGDTLVALDGLRATGRRLDALAATRRAGDVIRVHAFRRHELLAFDVTLGEPPRDTAWLALDPDADAQAVARRDAWLGA